MLGYFDIKNTSFAKLPASYMPLTNKLYRTSRGNLLYNLNTLKTIFSKMFEEFDAFYDEKCPIHKLQDVVSIPGTIFIFIISALKNLGLATISAAYTAMLTAINLVKLLFIVFSLGFLYETVGGLNIGDIAVSFVNTLAALAAVVVSIVNILLLTLSLFTRSVATGIVGLCSGLEAIGGALSEYVIDPIGNLLSTMGTGLSNAKDSITNFMCPGPTSGSGDA